VTALSVLPPPQTENLRSEVIESLRQFPVTREAWNALAQVSETNTVFQTYEWFMGWCQVFAEAAPLRIVLIYASDRLVGIAPLMLDLSRGNKRTLRFVCDTHADYCDILAGEHKRAVVEQLLQVLSQRRTEWDSLSFFNIPESSSTLALLQELTPNFDLHLLLHGKVACPTIRLGALADHGAGLLNKQSLKRPYNFFHRHGRLEARHISDLPTAEALLPQFFRQHVERWSDTRSPSLFERDINRIFYANLVHVLLPTGWLRFSVIELDGHPIAYHLGFAYAGTFFWYKPSFDVRLRKRSPGTLLLRFLVAQAIQERCTEFDFTVGNEAFKNRYCNDTRYNRNALIHTRRLPYLLACASNWCKQVLKRLHPGHD
jgi:CelD/BcsL family acetyltransferase involved in cellulose biosynthesis